MSLSQKLHRQTGYKSLHAECVMYSTDANVEKQQNIPIDIRNSSHKKKNTKFKFSEKSRDFMKTQLENSIIIKTYTEH